MAELAVRLTPMIEAAIETADEPETDVDVDDVDADGPREITPTGPFASPSLAGPTRASPRSSTASSVRTAC
jgi:hypothetical protein